MRITNTLSNQGSEETIAGTWQLAVKVTIGQFTLRTATFTIPIS